VSLCVYVCVVWSVLTTRDELVIVSHQLNLSLCVCVCVVWSVLTTRDELVIIDSHHWVSVSVCLCLCGMECLDHPR